ncbi:MAG: peptidoglycan-binding protein [Alphaproteobacteria bacterium]
MSGPDGRKAQNRHAPPDVKKPQLRSQTPAQDPAGTRAMPAEESSRSGQRPSGLDLATEIKRWARSVNERREDPNHAAPTPVARDRQDPDGTSNKSVTAPSNLTEIARLASKVDRLSAGLETVVDDLTREKDRDISLVQEDFRRLRASVGQSFDVLGRNDTSTQEMLLSRLAVLEDRFSDLDSELLAAPSAAIDHRSAGPVLVGHMAPAAAPRRTRSGVRTLALTVIAITALGFGVLVVFGDLRNTLSDLDEFMTTIVAGPPAVRQESDGAAPSPSATDVATSAGRPRLASGTPRSSPLGVTGFTEPALRTSLDGPPAPTPAGQGIVAPVAQRPGDSPVPPGRLPRPQSTEEAPLRPPTPPGSASSAGASSSIALAVTTESDGLADAMRHGDPADAAGQSPAVTVVPPDVATPIVAVQRRPPTVTRLDAGEESEPDVIMLPEYTALPGPGRPLPAIVDRGEGAVEHSGDARIAETAGEQPPALADIQLSEPAAAAEALDDGATIPPVVLADIFAEIMEAETRNTGDTSAASDPAAAGTGPQPVAGTDTATAATVQAAASLIPPEQSTDTPAGRSSEADTARLTLGVQRALAARGYDPGQPDGIAGRDTIGAIRQYQLDVGLPVDGQVSETLLANLTARQGSPDSGPRRSIRSIGLWTQQELAVQGFYTGPLTGVIDGETRVAINAYQADAGVPPLPGLSNQALLQHLIVVGIQQELVSKGYFVGPADGRLSAEVEAAIRAYKSDMGLSQIAGLANYRLLLHLRYANSESRLGTTRQ